MRVTNIHTRTIRASRADIWKLMETLSTDNDKVVATHKWPKVVLDKGLTLGSRGGHGPIGYTIQDFKPPELIQFNFTKPLGFHGFHKFEIREIEDNKTEIKHTLEMNASVKAYILWIVGIRWLHDAFMEDAFDKVES